MNRFAPSFVVMALVIFGILFMWSQLFSAEPSDQGKRNTSSMLVRVVDNKGEPISRATVHLRETSRGAYSDKNGIALVKGLPDDSFKVSVSFCGYYNAEKIVILRADKQTRLLATLQPRWRRLSTTYGSSVGDAAQRGTQSPPQSDSSGAPNARRITPMVTCGLANGWKEFEDDDTIAVSDQCSVDKQQRSQLSRQHSTLEIIEDDPVVVADTLSRVLPVLVYPNPIRQVCTMSIVIEQRAQLSVAFYTLDGKLLLQFDIGDVDPGLFEHKLNCSDLEAGTYLMAFRCSNGQNAVMTVSKSAN